jgi:[ribosomal protein S18]-alanine N-acetyltransferase
MKPSLANTLVHFQATTDLPSQVPGGEYDDSALDSGGSLRPDLTGKGLGREANRTGLEFGAQVFRPRAFRVTIASFNARAQRVIAALGFRPAGTFAAATDGRSYGIWLRSEAGSRFALPSE